MFSDIIVSDSAKSTLKDVVRSIPVPAPDTDGSLSPPVAGADRAEGSKDAATAVAALAASIKQQPGSPTGSLLVPVEEIAEEVSGVDKAVG